MWPREFKQKVTLIKVTLIMSYALWRFVDKVLVSTYFILMKWAKATYFLHSLIILRLWSNCATRDGPPVTSLPPPSLHEWNQTGGKVMWSCDWQPDGWTHCTTRRGEVEKGVWAEGGGRVVLPTSSSSTAERGFALLVAGQTLERGSSLGGGSSAFL